MKRLHRHVWHLRRNGLLHVATWHRAQRHKQQRLSRSTQWRASGNDTQMVDRVRMRTAWPRQRDPRLHRDPQRPGRGRRLSTSNRWAERRERPRRSRRRHRRLLARVWAARGLLHVWDDVATDAIITATTHAAWRVREMSAKVIARHHVGSAIDAVVILLDDENARVRASAARPFRTIAES